MELCLLLNDCVAVHIVCSALVEASVLSGHVLQGEGQLDGVRLICHEHIGHRLIAGIVPAQLLIYVPCGSARESDVMSFDGRLRFGFKRLLGVCSKQKAGVSLSSTVPRIQFLVLDLTMLKIFCFFSCVLCFNFILPLYLFQMFNKCNSWCQLWYLLSLSYICISLLWVHLKCD